LLIKKAICSSFSTPSTMTSNPKLLAMAISEPIQFETPLTTAHLPYCFNSSACMSYSF
jgi:hypothetical protein